MSLPTCGDILNAKLQTLMLQQAPHQQMTWPMQKQQEQLQRQRPRKLQQKPMRNGLPSKQQLITRNQSSKAKPRQLRRKPPLRQKKLLSLSQLMPKHQPRLQRQLLPPQLQHPLLRKRHTMITLIMITNLIQY